jgi:AraC-like DNA-binding protein
MRADVRYWLAPGMRSVELIAANYVAQRFSPHWHTGFAVGVVTRNTQRFSADGREWLIGPGDLITLNPGQVHDGSSLQPQGWSSRMAYAPEAALAALLHGEPGDGRLGRRFAAPVQHAPALVDQFLRWHCGTEARTGGECVALAIPLFGQLLALMQPASQPAASRSLAFSERLLALSDGAEHAVALLAQRHNVSRTTSWRQMRARLGLGPQPLVTHLRLMSAKRELALGRPVLDTALAAGYHDQSHFTRQFSAAYGMTPAQFRKTQAA